MALNRTACAIGALTALLSACGGGGGEQESEETVTGQRADQQATTDAEVEVRDLSALFEDEPRFSTFYRALEAADLMGTLQTEEALTIFAPNNDAFENLPEAASIDVLTQPGNRDLLREILSYHIVPGEIESSALVGEDDRLETVTGSELAFDGTGTVVQVGNGPQTAVVTIPDIRAENGIVHVVDAVLLPPAD